MTEAYGVIHEGQMARAKEQLGVKGQNLFELYQFVTRERPEILDCEIEFVTSCSSPENQNPDTFRITVGAWRPPNVDDGIAGLFIDIEGGLAKVASLHPIRKASIDRMAELLNLPTDYLVKRPEVVFQFIFLHELGHHHEYVSMFLPHNTIEEANRLKRNDRLRQMDSLPVPRKGPGQVYHMEKTGLLESFLERNKDYFNSLRVHTSGELAIMHEREYINMPSEKYANDFAASIMRLMRIAQLSADVDDIF